MKNTKYTVIQTTYLGHRVLSASITRGVNLHGLTVGQLRPVYGTVEVANADGKGRPMVTYFQKDGQVERRTTVWPSA